MLQVQACAAFERSGGNVSQIVSSSHKNKPTLSRGFELTACAGFLSTATAVIDTAAVALQQACSFKTSS
jgi:hypothetical protein